MHVGTKPVRLSLALSLGLLALFVRANFSLICNTPRDRVFPDRVKIKITISQRVDRGLQFANRLQPNADAHYVGKGVSFGEADTPIFWYRPKESKKYRVIDADLSVREADVPPNVPTPSCPKK